MTLDSLDPQTLRHSPQLAALDLLANVAEVTLVTLCAAHTAIEHELRHDPELPIERLADHIVHRVTQMLDTVGRYRLLLLDLERLRRGIVPDDDDIDIDF